MNQKKYRFWALVPAGGVGKRMRTSVPKQYLKIGRKPVIHHTLDRLCNHRRLQGVLVGIRDNDRHWLENIYQHEKLLGWYSAGAERMDTVIHGLQFLASSAGAEESDWVLVHDAVRPNISRDELDALLFTVNQRGMGAVLGLPLLDTLKKVSGQGKVECTVNRIEYWRALTPQVFQIGSLLDALNRAKTEGIEITDESMAMELAGNAVMMIEGKSANIKITYESDLQIMQKMMEL